MGHGPTKQGCTDRAVPTDWVGTYSWKCAGCGADVPRDTAHACSKNNPPLPGVKHDADKARWDLVPYDAMTAVVSVLTYGAAKYSPDNWRHVQAPRARYYAAAMRHLVAWYGGEWLDPESGHPHLAHAVCCLLFLLALRPEAK